MKQRCPECGRLVGIKAGKIIAKHRSKRGTKNRHPGERHPYCQESGRPYKVLKSEKQQVEAAVPVIEPEAPPMPASPAGDAAPEIEKTTEKEVKEIPELIIDAEDGKTPDPSEAIPQEETKIDVNPPPDKPAEDGSEPEKEKTD